MNSTNSTAEGSPATRTQSASTNRLSTGNNELESGMVHADNAGVLFTAAGADKINPEHSPLRAADHFNMASEPLGSGGGTDSDDPLFVEPVNTDGAN